MFCRRRRRVASFDIFVVSNATLYIMIAAPPTFSD